MWAQDKFLSNWLEAREQINSAEFSTVVSPVDGVAYPYINTDIPELYRDEIGLKLSLLLDRSIKINWLFMRLMPGGVRAPHQVHTDRTMGQFSLMLYMNYRIHCCGGTSIVRHKSGMLDEHPEDAGGGAIWQRDHADYNAWKIIGECPMRPNRAFVFDAKLLHRAEPVEGFGRAAQNARCVWTCFFDEVPA